MQIKDWENYVFRKYDAIRVDDINDLKQYIIGFDEANEEFFIAYEIDNIIVFITKFNNSFYRTFMYQKSNEISNNDYSKLSDFLLQLYKDKNIERHLELIKKTYQCEIFSWEKLIKSDKDFFERTIAFSVANLTEAEIMDDEYYASYVFDESKIANREIKPGLNSGWNTLIVFIASNDKSNISKWSAHSSNGLSREESDKFFNDINPLK